MAAAFVASAAFVVSACGASEGNSLDPQKANGSAAPSQLFIGIHGTGICISNTAVPWKEQVISRLAEAFDTRLQGGEASVVSSGVDGIGVTIDGPCDPDKPSLEQGGLPFGQYVTDWATALQKNLAPSICRVAAEIASWRNTNVDVTLGGYSRGGAAALVTAYKLIAANGGDANGLICREGAASVRLKRLLLLDPNDNGMQPQLAAVLGLAGKVLPATLPLPVGVQVYNFRRSPESANSDIIDKLVSQLPLTTTQQRDATTPQTSHRKLAVSPEAFAWFTSLIKS